MICLVFIEEVHIISGGNSERISLRMFVRCSLSRKELSVTSWIAFRYWTKSIALVDT
jgi:hypothetical protein